MHATAVETATRAGHGVELDVGAGTARQQAATRQAATCRASLLAYLGLAGTSAEAFDADAVADALRELLADPPAPADVRAHVDRFSWDTNAEQLEAHLRTVAGKT